MADRPSLIGMIRCLYDQYQLLGPDQRTELKHSIKESFFRTACDDAKGMLATMALTASVLGGISGLDYLGNSTGRTPEWTVRNEESRTVIERRYPIGGRTIYVDKDLDGRVDAITDHIPRAGTFQRKITPTDQYVFSEKAKRPI